MTRSHLERVIRKSIGPSGRVWVRGGRYLVGYTDSGKNVVMGAGNTPADALRALYDATRQAAGLEPVFTQPPRIAATPKPMSVRAWFAFVGFFARLFEKPTRRLTP